MKSSHPPESKTEIQQELRLLYARRGVVDRLIDLLEAYDRAHPRESPIPISVAPELRARRRQATA